MIQTLTPRGNMTVERKRIRLNAAARRLGIQASYLSQINKSGGVLEREGVTVIRYPDLPDVVEFYEDELFAWWQARHPDWTDPGQA
jgi:hypothetical protein